MNTKKFTVRMADSQWVCTLNAGTLAAFEKLSGKRALGGMDWIDSVNELAQFLLATMRPEQPELTLEKVLSWLPIEEIPLLTLQWDLIRGVCAARSIKVTPEVEAIFREKLGENFLAVLKAAPAARDNPSEATGPLGANS